MNKIPDQPTYIDKQGVKRFIANPIVEHLLDEGGMDMNYLSIWCIENNIDPEFEAQFAQLIGYSVSGWGTLSYVTDCKWERAMSRAVHVEGE